MWRRIAATVAGMEGVSVSNLVLDSSMKILFMQGTKSNESVSRKCAVKIKEVNPKTVIRCFNGYAHAQLACFEPENWIKEVSAFINS